MDTPLKIKTKDGFLLHGDLRKTSGKKSARALVIFCHGFLATRNQHIFFNGAGYFSQKGFDAFRFSFYGGEKGARHFEQATFTQHGSDIATVVKFFRKSYDRIYVIGHSFGGTSLLFTDQKNIDGFVFWDASYVDPEVERRDIPFNRAVGGYLLDYGWRTVVGKPFAEEIFALSNCGERVAAIHKPVAFIGAGKANAGDAKKYFLHANEPKFLSVVEVADHNFDQAQDEQTLFAATYQIIKKW